MAGLPRTIPELVKKAIAGALQDVHIALPGQVVRYDATENLADVQVMVQHPVYDDDNERTFEDIGTLLGVPVKWPRAGGYIMTLPLAPGDTGELIFHSTPIGEWRSTGQSSQPEDASRHSIGWPTFSPDLCADINPPALGDLTQRTAGVVLGKDGSAEQVLIQSGLIQAGASGAQALPTKADYDALVAALLAFVTGLNAGTLVAQAGTLVTALTAPHGSAVPAYTTLFKAK